MLRAPVQPGQIEKLEYALKDATADYIKGGSRRKDFPNRLIQDVPTILFKDAGRKVVLLACTTEISHSEIRVFYFEEPVLSLLRDLAAKGPHYKATLGEVTFAFVEECERRVRSHDCARACALTKDRPRE